MTPHLGRVLAAIVAVMAWRVAKLRPQHRPLAWWLVAAALADLARWGLGLLLAAEPRPYAGAARVAFHADQALLLVEPVGLAAVAVLVLTGARTAPIHGLGAAALTWVALIAGYSRGLRGAVMRYVYGGVEVAALLATAVAATLWAKQRRWPSMTEILLAVYVSVRVSLLTVGPYAVPDTFAEWWRGDGAQMTAVMASLLVHIAWLRSLKT